MNILKSFVYAIQGLWHCISTQRNFRFHIVAALSVLIVSLFYDFELFEMLSLGVAIVFVLICEMINTAIEAVVDMHGSEYNAFAKIAKDVAAGAVILSAVFATVVALCLFPNIEKIFYTINFFVNHPYMWVVLVIYIIASVCFVVGLPFKNKESNNG
jgi:diacylglycerol kinase (ATP)